MQLSCHYEFRFNQRGSRAQPESSRFVEADPIHLFEYLDGKTTVVRNNTAPLCFKAQTCWRQSDKNHTWLCLQNTHASEAINHSAVTLSVHHTQTHEWNPYQSYSPARPGRALPSPHFHLLVIYFLFLSQTILSRLLAQRSMCYPKPGLPAFIHPPLPTTTLPPPCFGPRCMLWLFLCTYCM